MKSGMISRMKIYICMILAMFILSGCVHKIDVEQGNIIDPVKVARLHPGMSRQSVINLMGRPLLQAPFSHNSMAYVYTFHPGKGSPQAQSVLLKFQDNHLISIQKK